MNDIDIVKNYHRNIRELQGRGVESGKKLKDFQTITNTFEEHYKNNCACPVKKGKNHWYRLCDCYNNSKIQQ